MAGRPGHRTMEMNGRSTAVSYLVRTPCVSFLTLTLIGLVAKRLLAGDVRLLRLYGGTFARSHSVSIRESWKGQAIIGIVQLDKGVGNNKGLSQKCAKMGLVSLGKEERSKMRQK